ncbi:MAG: CRTAC1 family protein, partial [Verrucomicrobiota bacterium]
MTWQAIDSARYAELARPATGSVGFKLLEPALTGVAFTNRLSEERYLTNQIYLNGSGVAAGDVDGDGWTDLYFCGLENPNALFRNLGNWKFEEVTANSGLAAQNLDATGAALCDLDGDRDLDLVLNSVAQGTWIYLNDGKGHFVHASTVNQNKAGMSLALADIDGDGDLDLYVANYRVSTIRDEPNTRLRVQETNGQINVISVNGRPATEPDLVGRFTLSPSGKIKENGEADALFLNDGKAGFTPVSWTSGAFLDADGRPLKTPPYDWGLSVMFRDINADGAPDLYVCNDFESDDRIWINNGKGQFRALPPLALRSTSMFSMGVDFADIDRDGYDDFFVADMLSPHHLSRHLLMGEVPPMFPQIGKLDDRPQYSRNTLFWNRGDGGFAEIGQFSGVEASDWSWTPLFLDVDLDGYEDLLITTGHELEMMNADVIQRAEVMKSQRQMSVRELLELRKMFSRLALPKVAFRNKGNLKFEMVTSEWGFNQIGVSHGMAAADLDHDGDLDLIVNNLNGVAGVYRNEASAPRIAVRLKGNPPNTHGIGARISLRGGAFTQSQEIICGGRYLSSDDPVRTFAAGSGTNFTLEVNWRNGRQTVIHPVQPNRLYEIAEGNSQPKSKSAPTAPPRTFNVPLFEDLTRALNHVHAEE